MGSPAAAIQLLSSLYQIIFSFSFCCFCSPKVQVFSSSQEPLLRGCLNGFPTR